MGKATRLAGCKVDQQLRGLISRIMEISGSNVADSFAWLEAEGQLTRVGDSFRLHRRASARVDRLEGETRLPPATFDVEGDNMVIHFPEDGDLRPFYGLVYSQLGDAPLEQVGYAEAQLTVPIDRRLTLQAYEPGRYGRPFQGLPPDLFDRIVATQMGPKTTDDDMEAFSDLYQTRQLSIGYTYEAGLIFGHGSAHPVSDSGSGAPCQVRTT